MGTDDREVSATHVVPELDGPRRRRLEQRARLLALTSVTYNGIEAVVALAAGAVAGSTALLGFGLDSAVEVSSGLVVIWQLSRPTDPARERRAARLIAVSFFALAALVTVESLRALLTGDDADTSRTGIALACASLLIMPVLSRAQRRTGRALHSVSVVADSAQTRLCAWMSAVLLGGLGLNAVFGWGWADAAAGLGIAVIAAWEGSNAWRGKGCCVPSAGHPPH